MKSIGTLDSFSSFKKIIRELDEEKSNDASRDRKDASVKADNKYFTVSVDLYCAKHLIESAIDDLENNIAPAEKISAAMEELTKGLRDLFKVTIRDKKSKK